MKKSNINIEEIIEKQSTHIPNKLFNPKPMENQRQTILRLLKEGHRLSKLQIINKYGILNAGARIEELRNKLGHNEIKTEMIKNKSTKRRFAVYYIQT